MGTQRRVMGETRENDLIIARRSGRRSRGHAGAPMKRSRSTTPLPRPQHRPSNPQAPREWRYVDFCFGRAAPAEVASSDAQPGVALFRFLLRSSSRFGPFPRAFARRLLLRGAFGRRARAWLSGRIGFGQSGLRRNCSQSGADRLGGRSEHACWFWFLSLRHCTLPFVFSDWTTSPHEPTRAPADPLGLLHRP